MPRPRRSAPVAQPDRPVTASETRRLFKALAARRHVALAVSGGGDSTALMWLVAAWAKAQKSPPKISVLTVDHGYRTAAAAEARQVTAWAEALGLEAHILTSLSGKPESGLQQKGRAVRYRLMTEWCRRAGADVLATAHTQEDQAETLLMRLARGSGIVGLGAMAAEGVSEDGFPIVRPFLEISRRRLRATLREAGHPWIDDPSNEDTAFERVKLRKMMPKLAEIGLTSAALARSAQRLGRAAKPLLQSSESLLKRAADLRPQGYAFVNIEEFRTEEAETRILALQELLKILGGNKHGARLSEIERLDEWIMNETSQARTLAGCRIARRSKVLVVGREPGRIAGTPVALPENGRVVWDRRYLLEWESGPKGAVIVPAGLVAGLERVDGLPAFVQASLPAIMAEGRSVGLPFSLQPPAGLTCRFLGTNLFSALA
ncbi:MAG: tRNA lysidine(34) synthetase TilS [Rhizobiales bacterium]|nr:tRNA lysidine(34) synthetase TilS [Hyphomicrobiales bacterium]